MQTVTLRPSAHGSLAKTPFAHLLLYLQTRKLSGTLAIWPESGSAKSSQDRILFEGGQLVAMRPAEPATSLYAALLPLFARVQAPYGFYEGYNLIGQSHVLREAIDFHTLLARGVQVRAEEPIMDAVLERVRGRSLRLRAGTPLDRLEFGPRELALIEPLRSASATVEGLLGAGILPTHEVKRTLYLLTLIRGLEATEDKASLPRMTLESFHPKPEEMGGAQAVHGGALVLDTTAVRLQVATAAHDTERTARSSPRPPPPSAAPSESPDASGPQPAVTLDRDAGRSPASTQVSTANDTSPSAPPAPLGLSPADQARWNELAGLYVRLDELTHYDLLNLPQTASAQDAQTAYFALVKRVHPDRLPLALAPLARIAQVVFERVTEAHETLGDAALRAAYDQAVAGGGGTRAAERRMRNVLESALEYQKAEVLVRRREYAQAMQLLRSALGKSPDEADYHALYAWILHLTNPGTPAPLDEMLRSLDRALKENPRHERAHYYKGVVLKRLKRDGEAVRHFRAAAEINPHNVDAAREVRLATMRRESKPPPASHGGVLSRLFKK